MKLTTQAKRERLLLAEEAALIALADNVVIADGADARALLAVPATHDLAEVARSRFVQAAHATLPTLLDGPISKYAQQRADALLADHARLRAASGVVARLTVEAALPPDVIGLFVLLPAEA